MNLASLALEPAAALPERRRRCLQRPRVLSMVLGALVAAALAAAAAAALASHLLINVTRSMPLGVYWMRRGSSARSFGRHDLVAFPVPPSVKGLVLDRHYLMDGALLLKPIAAVAGDVVCIEGDALTVNGQLAGRLRSRDSEGRGLPRDARCEALDAGLVYVLAPDPRSFDSRVFGPVHVATLSEVTPLWTF